eukprot:jgi/Botrbrau1/11195/Bobra.0214s0020.1
MVLWKSALTAAGPKLGALCCQGIRPSRSTVVVENECSAGAVVDWNDLPDDIEGKILGYLSLGDFKAAALVCKRWHREYRSKLDYAGARLVRSDLVRFMISKEMYFKISKRVLRVVRHCWDDMCQHLAQHMNAEFLCWVDKRGQRWHGDPPTVRQTPPNSFFFEVSGHSHEGAQSSSRSARVHWCLHVYLHHRAAGENGRVWLQTRCDVTSRRRGRCSSRHLIHGGSWPPHDSSVVLSLLIFFKRRIVRSMSMFVEAVRPRLAGQDGSALTAPATLRFSAFDAEGMPFRGCDDALLLRMALWDMGGRWLIFRPFDDGNIRDFCKYHMKRGHFGELWALMRSMWAQLQAPTIHGLEPLWLGSPQWH